jgi:hypothetical protein
MSSATNCTADLQTGSFTGWSSCRPARQVAMQWQQGKNCTARGMSYNASTVNVHQLLNLADLSQADSVTARSCLHLPPPAAWLTLQEQITQDLLKCSCCCSQLHLLRQLHQLLLSGGMLFRPAYPTAALLKQTLQYSDASCWPEESHTLSCIHGIGVATSTLPAHKQTDS